MAKAARTAKARPAPAKADAAAAFVARLEALQSDAELAKIRRYFKANPGDYAAGDVFMGVRMGSLFALADEFVAMAPGEIEVLLESPIHEVRAGGLSIMAKQMRRKATTAGRRKELYDLYLRRHDRINTWDLVDLGAWHVVGAYLIDRPRAVLRRLARSKNMWERRTAMLATFAFIKRDEFDDTLQIAETLLGDREDLIHKAAGGMLREVGRRDKTRLTAFLEKHAAAMPRTMLRTAIEKLPQAERTRYLKDAGGKTR
ncbi:MAG: DNA alkylation repair protein [Bauldia sp.]